MMILPFLNIHSSTLNKCQFVVVGWQWLDRKQWCLCTWLVCWWLAGGDASGCRFTRFWLKICKFVFVFWDWERSRLLCESECECECVNVWMCELWWICVLYRYDMCDCFVLFFFFLSFRVRLGQDWILTQIWSDPNFLSLTWPMTWGSKLEKFRPGQSGQNSGPILLPSLAMKQQLGLAYL